MMVVIKGFSMKEHILHISDDFHFLDGLFMQENQ